MMIQKHRFYRGEHLKAYIFTHDEGACRAERATNAARGSSTLKGRF